MTKPVYGKQRSYVGAYAKGDVKVRGYATDFDPKIGSSGGGVGNYSRLDSEQGYVGTGKMEFDTTAPMTNKGTFRGRAPSYGKQRIVSDSDSSNPYTGGSESRSGTVAGKWSK